MVGVAVPVFAEKQIQSVTTLTPPLTNDTIFYSDQSDGGALKQAPISSIQGTGSGGDLGANLTSLNDSITSNTNQINMPGMEIVAETLTLTGTQQADVDSLRVVQTLRVPVGTSLALGLDGEMGVDSDPTVFSSSLVYKADGERRMTISMDESNAIALSDGDGLFYNSTTDEIYGALAAQERLAQNGNDISLLTNATQNFAIGGATIPTADIALSSNGEAVFNRNGENVIFQVEGDTEENMIYAINDNIGIRNNNPQHALDIIGTLNISGTSDSYVKFNEGAGCYTADPCGTIGEASIFYNCTAKIFCGCTDTADVKLSDGTACY